MTNTIGRPRKYEFSDFLVGDSEVFATFREAHIFRASGAAYARYRGEHMRFSCRKVEGGYCVQRIE